MGILQELSARFRPDKVKLQLDDIQALILRCRPEPYVGIHSMIHVDEAAVGLRDAILRSGLDPELYRLGLPGEEGELSRSEVNPHPRRERPQGCRDDRAGARKPSLSRDVRCHGEAEGRGLREGVSS